MTDVGSTDIGDTLPPGVSSGETIYVVDRDLRIVYVNEQWSRFAEHNNGERMLQPDATRSLLDQFSGTQKAKFAQIYRLLLEGRLPHYTEQINASGPEDRRVFQLRISPKADAGGQVRWLVHHTIPKTPGSQDHEQLRRTLASLSEPRRLQHEYRKRVVERPIHFGRFRTARYFRPLEDVGGDLLWSCDRPDGASYLVHGDVMGHGREAGELATRIAVLLDEIVPDAASAADVVEQLNDFLLEHRPAETIVFATGLVFTFAADEDDLRCISFGHHGPIFSRSGQVEVTPGLPIGIMPAAEPWLQTRIDLERHGHRFLVFSDGIIEQFDRHGIPFGTERLVQTFRDLLDEPLDHMLRQIIHTLTDHRGPAIIKDDQTLLALELPEQL